jgi:hypothetical protein
VWIGDRRAEMLAAVAAGAEVDLVAERERLDALLLEPLLSEITDPKQRVLRMLKGA